LRLGWSGAAYHTFLESEAAAALALLREAHTLSPNHPMILAGLASAEVRAWFLDADPPAGTKERVLEVARQAVALDPRLGESYVALGQAQLNAGDPIAAVRALRTAIALSPSCAEAHDVLGRLLFEIGEVDEGFRRVECALRLDRALIAGRCDAIRVKALLGDWDRALAELAELENEPVALSTAIRIHAWRGNMEKVKRTDPGALTKRAVPSIILDSITGDAPPEIAYNVLDKLVGGFGTSARRRSFYLQLKCEVASVPQDAAIFFATLERAIDAGLIDLLWLERMPRFARFREHPSYGPVHARLKERSTAILDAFRGE
jgi:serine/threonine-protein kinase